MPMFAATAREHGDPLFGEDGRRFPKPHFDPGIGSHNLGLG